MTEDAELEQQEQGDKQTPPDTTDAALAKLLVLLEQVPFDFLSAPAAVVEQRNSESKGAAPGA